MINTKYRFAALLLAIVMLFSTAGTAFAADFSDTSTHWANAEIGRWSTLGIIEGADGRFRPDDPITRAETSVIIDRIMKYRTASQNTFTDLTTTWYTDAILRVNAAGVILGDAGRVRPTDYITRQEAVVVLCRALGISELDGATDFADDSAIASWAKPYVKALSQRGFVSGVGNNMFAPAERITRASVVKLLDNAISAIYNSAGDYSANAAGTVIVCAPDVTFSDMTISGDLIISEGIGSGDITLNNVNVAGKVVIRGGSSSVRIFDSSITALQVESRDGIPKIYVSDATDIGFTYLRSSAILEENSNLSGKGFVDLQAESSSTIRIDLIGSFGRLTQSASDARYRINGHVADIKVFSNCEFSGDFSYLTLDISNSAVCKVNGEAISGSTASGLLSLTIAVSSVDGAPRVGDVLTASTVTAGVVPITYKWYWSSSNLQIDSTEWNLISGLNSKTYTIPASMDGYYIKLEAAAAATTLTAKLPGAISTSTSDTTLVTVENYGTATTPANETIVRFVFARPLAFATSSGLYTPIDDNYDFKSSASRWFSVRIGTATATTDNRYISSAIYSALDNSITVTLTGDAASASNKIALKLAADMYDIYGTVIKSTTCPTAVRMANCSSWQNGSSDGNGPFDTAPPAASVAPAGNAANVLKLIFNEPLGYISNGIYRPASDGYNFKTTSGVSNLFNIKLNGNMYSNSDELVASAIYSTSDRSITITLQNASADESITIAPLMSFHDVFGNALTPATSGVYYRWAADTRWYKATTQAEADFAASGNSLSGLPSLVSGNDPARFGTAIVADFGTLNISNGLTFSWYRSNDASFSEASGTLLGTGTKYTPIEADISKHLILVVTSSAIPGECTYATALVEKADTTVIGNTPSVTYVSGGVYNLDLISGLFDIDSDGLRTYSFPKDTSYKNAVLGGNVLTVQAPGEFRLQVKVTGSAKYKDYTGTETAILKITDPAPRTIPITALNIPTNQPFTDSDLGKAWFSVNLTSPDNKVYIKNSAVSSTTTLGEPLSRGDVFTGAGYTPLVGTSQGTTTFSGSAVPGGSISVSAGGTYYIVETTSDNKVVATGVVSLTKHMILARVTIMNSCETKSIKGYAVTASTTPTADNKYVAENITAAFHTIYVPLDTYYITLYENAPADNAAPSGASYTVSLTFDSCRTSVTVSDTTLK